MFLMQFNLNLHYIPGSKNCLADALSRSFGDMEDGQKVQFLPQKDDDDFIFTVRPQNNSLDRNAFKNGPVPVIDDRTLEVESASDGTDDVNPVISDTVESSLYCFHTVCMADDVNPTNSVEESWEKMVSGTTDLDRSRADEVTSLATGPLPKKDTDILRTANISSQLPAVSGKRQGEAISSTAKNNVTAPTSPSSYPDAIMAISNKPLRHKQQIPTDGGITTPTDGAHSDGADVSPATDNPSNSPLDATDVEIHNPPEGLRAGMTDCLAMR